MTYLHVNTFLKLQMTDKNMVCKSTATSINGMGSVSLTQNIHVMNVISMVLISSRDWNVLPEIIASGDKYKSCVTVLFENSEHLFQQIREQGINDKETRLNSISR